MTIRSSFVVLTFVATAATAVAFAQAPALDGAAADRAAGPAVAAVTPPGFVIGFEDVLSIVFWHDKDMSSDVTVRPDGKISLPLLNEVQAAGLTPADLGARLAAESKRFFANANVTVVVKQINSRKVFITGQVVKPGPYVIVAPTDVLQLISMAGGLRDFADGRNIMIVRQERGQKACYTFNYKDIRRNLQQNIELRPGDTVVVP